MSALPTPMMLRMRKAQRALGGWLLACTLVGCAASGSVKPEDVAGSAAEAEVHRLAKTRLQLAALHFEEGRVEVALGEVAQALQAYPRYVDAFNLKGWMHMSQRDLEAAQQSFAQALSLRPNDADTLYNVGWLQCQQKKFTLADRSFAAALEAPRSIGATSLRTWLAKGVCLRQAGQLEPALQALGKANEIDPSNPAVAYSFSEALYSVGQTERARFYVRRMNNGSWATAESLWLGVKIERSLGDSVAMRQLADQLNKRFPNSKEWQWFERGAFDE